MKRKLLAGFLALVMAAAPVFSAVPAAHAATPHEVKAQTSGTEVVIGNDLIQRVFSTADDKLTTTQIINKRTDKGDTVFTPAAGSEEFVIRVTKTPGEVGPAHPALNRDGWTAKADSFHNPSGPADGPAQNLLDGDLDSIWHTNYGGGTGQQNYPYNVVIDMKQEVTFQCFSYTPRQQGEATNGNILGYQLWTSAESGELAPNDASWVKAAEGEFKYNDTEPIYVNLPQAVSARQVKLVAVSAKNGQKFAGGAEFNLHKDVFAAADKCDREFAADDLELSGEPVITATDVVINGAAKHGQKVTFNFKPFLFKGVTYTISENVVMYDGDHFMRKFLEISVPEADRTKNPIDYIDLESFRVTEGKDKTWTIPHAGGIVALEEFKANLGQPIYIDGMFFGCEFPAADTQIEDGVGRMRYYTGKTFDRMAQDNQLTKDGKLVTWQTVAGAARSDDMQVLQADFFEYIKTISVPSDFRLQYNSWFDNMMLIDDQSIWKSFIEVDRELNRVEMRPLDSYVADDGWNNYNDGRVVDARRSGTTFNKTGFWEFNSKFPDEFYPSSQLVQNFGSSFGTWVGPRGGYNFYGHLASILTKSGKGSGAGGSVDVADRTYVQNFEDMAKRFQSDFGINYWKWDGFADDAQYGQFPGKDGVPGYANRHMTGGYHNMYHVTDLWEAWTDLIEHVRAQAKAEGIDDLWISLTCYTNPSPWFLQWGNSVWLQCTADQRNASFGSSHLDKQMTYRDACYYDFLNNHQFQFPLSNLYNHDPVYGVEGTGMNMNTADSENFRNYLYMMSTRGNAFWELHYSDSIMTEEKYEITSEFSAWAEANYHMLKNAKMIGKMPDVTHLDNFNSDQSQADAYGFSCFDGTDGILSMRNPTVNGPKTITFTFDRTMGVAEDCGVLQYHVEHSYKAPEGLATTGTLEYGKEYSFTLQPNEVLILRVSRDGDQTAPAFTRAYTDGKDTVTVKFNEKVTGQDLTIAGKTVTVAQSADGITYHLTVAEPLTNGETLTVTANGVKDLAGNAVAENSISTVFYADNLAAQGTGSAELGRVDLSDDGFTFHAAVKSPAEGAVLTHGDKAALGVNAEGKATFTLGKATAVSKLAVNDGAEHRITGVKENNGIIKIYVDGQLSGSAYDKDNRCLALGVADVTLAQAEDGFVYTEGKGYNAIQDLGADPADGPLNTEDMTVTVSGTSEGDKSKVFDNDPTTFWASQEVPGGIAKGNPFLTVDLGGEFMLNGVDYTKRYYDSDLNQWKCTGNLRTYFVEVSMDGEHWTTVSSGDTFADEDYTTKGDGGTTAIRFDAVKAKFVRISGGSSYHWQAENVNKFMTVGDLALYGEAYKPVEPEKPDAADPARDYKTETVTAGHAHNGFGADKINDNNADTFWQTGWTDDSGKNVNNRWIEMDLGAVKYVDGIRVLPRQGDMMGDENGTPIDYVVKVRSKTTDEWTTVAQGTRPTDGSWREWYLVNFDQVEARYVRFCGITTYGDTGNNLQMSLAEIRAVGPGTAPEPEGPTGDELAAAAVDAKITAIGAVTLASEQKITEARTAYGALTEAQKDLVTKLNVLTAAEKKLAELKDQAAQAEADKKAAAAVDAKITAIGTVTLDSEQVITEARAAYEALTAAQKALVTKLNVLTAAEETFAELNKPVEFPDVKPGDWFYNGVSYSAKRGFMNGLPDGTFGPKVTMTRAQLVQMLYALEGKPAVKNITDKFSDVKAGDWFADAVTWAVEAGVTGGVGAGQFAPNAKITRQEMAVMLYAYKGRPAAEGKLDFADKADIADWAAMPVVWAVDNGLMSSTSTEQPVFSPKSTATRAEAAIILMNLDMLSK